MKGDWGSSRKEVTIVNVYSACTIIEKKELWDELIRHKRANANEAWCVLGDFNPIRKIEERRGSSQLVRGMREITDFNIFIQAMELIYILMVGKRNTWYNASGTAKSRIDRILVSHSWLDCGLIVNNMS